MKPLVTILCLTYNQEKYVSQAIESFLSQKTAFPFEILIHDDASTDSTAEIIRKYADANKDIFRSVYESENQFSTTGLQFLEDMYKSARGKYIAICEGDDFWTDPDKLQQQVDFLEGHPECALVFHPVSVFVDGAYEDSVTFPDPKDSGNFTLPNLLKGNYIQTNSVMYRRQEYPQLPIDVVPFDWYMHLFHAQFGSLGFLPTTMAAYRRHPGGLWWDADRDIDQIWKKHGLSHLALFEAMLRLYGAQPDYRKIIADSITAMFGNLEMVDHKYGEHLLGQAVRRFPETTELFIVSLHRRLEAAEAPGATSAATAPEGPLGVRQTAYELVRAVRRSVRSRLHK